jgi:hypothetical protein
LLLNYAHEDLIPQYEAVFGGRVSNKVDYAIKLIRKEIIIIECNKLTSNVLRAGDHSPELRLWLGNGECTQL